MSITYHSFLLMLQFLQHRDRQGFILWGGGVSFPPKASPPPNSNRKERQRKKKREETETEKERGGERERERKREIGGKGERGREGERKKERGEGGRKACMYMFWYYNIYDLLN